MGSMKDLLGDSLYTPPPQQAYARRSDPETSHAAAKSIGDRVSKLEQMVLDALRSAGDRGMNLAELMDATGLDKVTVSPRLRPLANRGLVREAGKRPGRSGKQQIVWRMT